jgi:hypothetical protein
VKHRHLLSNEIDLLVDGEVGFGVAPLRAHVQECPDCRAKVEETRTVCDVLDRLPRLQPSPRFASRVMSQVHVFVPWHVAALDAARRLVPQSRPARLLVGAAAVSVATVLSLATLWVAARFDVVSLFSGVALQQARTALMGTLSDLVAAAFGESVLAMIRSSGVIGLAIGGVVLLAATAATAVGLRAVAGAAARRRP